MDYTSKEGANDVGTGTSATSRRCWMHKPVEPAAKALGKYIEVWW